MAQAGRDAVAARRRHRCGDGLRRDWTCRRARRRTHPFHGRLELVAPDRAAAHHRPDLRGAGRGVRLPRLPAAAAVRRVRRGAGDVVARDPVRSPAREESERHRVQLRECRPGRDLAVVRVLLGRWHAARLGCALWVERRPGDSVRRAGERLLVPTAGGRVYAGRACVGGRRRVRPRGRHRGDGGAACGNVLSAESAVCLQPSAVCRTGKGCRRVSKVAVVGAGTMGNGIAHVFAQHGWTVTLVDVAQDALARGLATIKKNVERLEKKGVIGHQLSVDMLGRIQTNTALDAVKDAELVVEAVSENPDTKFDIFEELDRLAPKGAILASNTSSISITEIAKQTKRPDRVIGMHFMNPVRLMPRVEIVRGRGTGDEVVARTVEITKQLGKTPVVVQDSPGFVSNRVLMPMINEAIFCVDEGVATPEAVDQVMKLGMNHPLGPLALADLIGLDVCLAIMKVLQDGLDTHKYRPAPLLEKMVAKGQLGRKSGQGFYAYRD